MKIWYPISLDTDNKQTKQDYIRQCLIDLYVFKQLLKKTMNYTRINSAQNKLKESTIIHTTEHFKLQEAMLKFVDCLSCHYDDDLCRCYYSVSDLVMCPRCEEKLNYVIRLVEFGNDSIPPMNWIRFTVIKFKDGLLRKNDS